ncbi:hypothetical protein EDC96DRAFT_574280 [Choanephora cucurbitarum]|nr:hypothetical protein EDC96DRAFT_574280 [Choanephora cucurbitarum]
MTTPRTMTTTMNVLMKQLKENPVNWALLAIFAYVVRSYATSNKPVIQAAKHPEVMVFKNYTPLDLVPFDGHDQQKPILMAVNGSVYDVTRGRNFYGPEGPYANFAGRDASRGLAKNSFDEDMLVDPKGPIDRLEDLSAEEWDSLREWEQHFATKYTLVVSLLSVQDRLRLAVVCRKWHQLVFDGSLWTTIDISPFYKSMPIELILKLIKSSGHFLRIANFRGCIQLTGHALRTLSAECPYINVLIIKDCRSLSTASINHFLEHANYLKVLDVSGLDTIKSSTLAHHTFQFQALKQLSLSWCRNLTGAGVLTLIQSCSQLTHLKLNGCPQLDTATMRGLGSLLLPNLVYLNLSACTSLTDAALLAFFEHHPHPTCLTHLTLSSCARLTDASVRTISLYATHLTHLALSGCVLLSDHGLSFLCLRLQLVYLDLEDIQQITGLTLTSIGNHQRQLEHLCLSNCIQLSDDDLIQLLVRSSRLSHLELDNCPITDRTVLAIANHLVSSKAAYFYLQVLDCSSVTEEGIREAQKKAGVLSIKSFYSFLSSEDEIAENRPFEPPYTPLIVHPRQRRLEANSIGQSGSGCIIL